MENRTWHSGSALKTIIELLSYTVAQSQAVSGRQNRSPGPPGLIPAALGISQSRKTRRATQALTREPVFTRRFDLFTEQPPGVCGRSTKSVSFRLLGRVRSFHGLYRPDLSLHTLH